MHAVRVGQHTSESLPSGPPFPWNSLWILPLLLTVFLLWVQYEG